MDRYLTFVTFLKKPVEPAPLFYTFGAIWVPPFACELAISSSQHSALIRLKLNLLNMLSYVMPRRLAFHFIQPESGNRHASRTRTRRSFGRSCLMRNFNSFGATGRGSGRPPLEFLQ